MKSLKYIRRKRSSKSSTRRKRSPKSSKRRKRSFKKKSFKIDGGVVQTCADCRVKGENLLKCVKCKDVYYCEICQEKNWKTHSKECVVPYETFADQETEECVVCLEKLGLRFISHLICCGSKICFPCYNNWTNKKIELDVLTGKPTSNKNCPMCREPQYTNKVAVEILTTKHKNKSWAHYDLGIRYKDGIGVLKNEAKAKIHLLKAAKENNLHAIQAIGTFYRDGEGGFSKSYDKAIEYYKRGSDQGLELCSVSLATLYFIEPHKNESLAVKYMKAAAHQNSVDAQYRLAKFYIKGLYGLPENINKGISFIINAADNGLQAAQIDLGIFYFNGKGVEKSTSLAIEYIKKGLSKKSLTNMNIEHYVNNITPISEDDRNYNVGTLAKCYDEKGPDQSLIDSYYFYKKFIKLHTPSCKGCVEEDSVNKRIEEIYNFLREFNKCSECKKYKNEGETPMMICSFCKLAFYCDKKCQEKNWESHKEICILIKEQNEIEKKERDEREKKVKREQIQEKIRKALDDEEIARKKAFDDEEIARKKALDDEETARQQAYAELMADEAKDDKAVKGKKGKKKWGLSSAAELDEQLNKSRKEEEKKRSESKKKRPESESKR